MHGMGSDSGWWVGRVMLRKGKSKHACCANVVNLTTHEFVYELSKTKVRKPASHKQLQSRRYVAEKPGGVAT